MSEKIRISFTEISHRLRAVALSEVDSVVRIATGGTVPASMLAHQLEKPLSLFYINYRSKDNSPRFQQAVLLKMVPSMPLQHRLLVVDEALLQKILLDCGKVRRDKSLGRDSDG